MVKASKIILIGGSAGSYSLIAEIIEKLPSYFDAAICIVLHRNKRFETQIEKNLARKLNKNIISAIDKLDINKNYIYFAVAGYHLLIEPDFSFSLDSSEHVNYSRPSIDVLFETAAQIYKDNCVAFLLSGANSDGAKGLRTIEQFGGEVIIQDPNQASMKAMPLAGERETLNPKIWSNSQILSYFNTLK